MSINMTIVQAMDAYSAMNRASQDSINARIERMVGAGEWPASNDIVIQAVRAEQIHTAPLA